MLLMKWARPTLRGMHATSRKLPAHGVPIRLSASNTGRGHCRARICISPRPGRNGLGAVLFGLFLRLDEPPYGTRQGAARDGVNVGQVGTG